MNLSKHLEFFDPINDIQAPIHIIGCGAIGSTLAEMLVRMGVQELNLYDFDTVDPHNLTNQMFRHGQIGMLKTIALEQILKEINPEVKLKLWNAGYSDQRLSGHVFLCVDNIDLRREICEAQKINKYVKSIYDFRMRLTDAQHYAADWSDEKSKQNLINTMQFTHDEAKEETPVNACGTTLNVNPTVRIVCSVGVSNFINFLKKNELKKLILIDSFNYMMDAF